VASALSPEVVLFLDTTRQFLERQSPVSGSPSGSGIADLALVARELGPADLPETQVSEDAVTAWAVWEDPAAADPAAVARSACRTEGGRTLGGKNQRAGAGHAP
jgi:hypothetical protein